MNAPALPQRLPFWKMHGAGNDFVVAESAEVDAPWSELAIRLCDRHMGVGADGLILVLPSDRADRRMRIFNPDGSEAEMCGNGVRVFAKYVLDRGLVDAPDGVLHVETIPGILALAATRNASGAVDEVRVAMGVPVLRPEAMGARIEQSTPVIDLPIKAAGESLAFTLVSMGNPHAVTFLARSPRAYPVERVGPAVERHALFANRTNVEFIHVTDRAHVEMRVWERGAGETLACGTGACAAVVASRLHGLVDDRVEVQLPGGVLTIEWDGVGECYLSGPAAFVFESVWVEGAR